MKPMLRCTSAASLRVPPPSPSSTSFSLRNYYIKHHLKIKHIINFSSKDDLNPTLLHKLQARSRPPLFYFNLYLQLYVNAGAMHEASTLFDEMPDRSLISWTILMSGYAKHGPVCVTLMLFIDMLCNGSVRPDAFVYSIVLRACADVRDLNFGCGIHAHVLKRGDVTDAVVENALVNLHARCGNLEDAVAVFEGIRRPDLVAWSSLLSGYVNNGLEEEGLRIFLEMIKNGVILDAFAFSMVIKGCANLEDFDFGKQIHCCMLKMGFGCHLFLEDSLMDFYAKCGDVEGLRRVFSGMNERDLVSWNTLIMGYVLNMLYLEALDVFRVLMEGMSYCDDFTIASILKAITSLSDVHLGREVHGYIIRVGLESNKYVIGSLLEMYIECINHETSNLCDKAPLTLYRSFEGEKINGYLVASMLKWCSLQSNLQTGEVFHSLIIKLNLNSDPYLISSLIDMYSKCGISAAALRVFQRVKDPGVTAWSALISGFSLNGRDAEALRLFQEMQSNFIEANEFTITSVLMACLALNDLRKGRELHCKILRTGYGSNVSAVNMLINLYSELWHHKQALKLCSLITDVEISWNSLLKACIKAKDYQKVHELLGRIQVCCGFVDPYSACEILNSCSNSMLLNVGTQAHAYMTKRGLISHPTVGNSLLNMYSGCGKIDDADLAFQSMPEKTSLSWTSLIYARVNHGHPAEALDLFKDMQYRNNSMNQLTFKSALKACALTGLVGEAYRLFMSMQKVYHIEPSEEHYSVMVEALGRAGMFEEALEFTKGIGPAKFGTLIWRTLLLSSRVHGDMKVAKYAVEKLLELDPSDCSANLMLKQVFFMLGKWGDASKMTVIDKSVGCNSSWIEIQNKIYEFVSDEKPTKQVSDKRAEIEKKMKELGFVYNMSCLKPTIDEEGYEGLGLHHTEMNAVALGLISLPHGTPIRVVKNVRMRGYSHSACKFMSSFIDSELVIKDPENFHHFNHGKCSCRDFW